MLDSNIWSFKWISGVCVELEPDKYLGNSILPRRLGLDWLMQTRAKSPQSAENRGKVQITVYIYLHKHVCGPCLFKKNFLVPCNVHDCWSNQAHKIFLRQDIVINVAGFHYILRWACCTTRGLQRSLRKLQEKHVVWVCERPVSFWKSLSFQKLHQTFRLGLEFKTSQTSIGISRNLLLCWTIFKLCNHGGWVKRVNMKGYPTWMNIIQVI